MKFRGQALAFKLAKLMAIIYLNGLFIGIEKDLRIDIMNNYINAYRYIL